MDFSNLEAEIETGVVAECEILDTAPEPEFDDLIQVAAAVCGTSFALMGLLDGERIWFKSKIGLAESEIPSGSSLCDLAMAQEDPLVIPDVLDDDRCAGFASIQDQPVRFFAGVSVRCAGETVGSLCTFDPEPKFLSPSVVAALDALARHVGTLLESRLANRRLLESERKLALALSSAELSMEHAGLAARRLETLFSRVPVPCFTCDADLTIFEWNRAAERLWNKVAYEAVMRPVPDVLGWPTDTGFIPDGFKKVFQGENIENYEWKTTLADGTHRWLISSAFPLQSSRGDVVGAVCTCADITSMKDSEERLNEYSSVLEQQKWELKQANVRLQELATTDGLTGLKNHRYFQESLENALTLARRYDRPLSLIVADVDQFKLYNDTFGHPAGDAVLVRIGQIFTEVARATDLVARYGGEEFVIVLPETGIEGANLAAERLRSAIEEDSQFQHPVTASFGVATLETPNDGRERLVQWADKALYSSKAAGRNRVTHWSEIKSAEAA